MSECGCKRGKSTLWMSCSPASAVVTSLQRACRAGGVRPEGGAEGLGSAPHRTLGLESVKCRERLSAGYRAGPGAWCCTAEVDLQGPRWGRTPLRGEQSCSRRSPSESPQQTAGPATRGPHPPDGGQTRSLAESLHACDDLTAETHLVLHALLGRVHGVALAALNTLQRLLNLWTRHV